MASPSNLQSRNKRKRDSAASNEGPLTLDTSLCVEILDEDLICCICHQIPLHPVETPCCGHIGCNICLQACLERANPTCPTCPSCRAVISKDRNLHLSAFALKKISGLKVRCPLAAEGCTATFLIGLQGGTYLRHNSECEYVSIRCPNCFIEVKRKDFRSHRSEVCIEREVKCQFCRQSMKFLSMEQHLKATEDPLLGCVNLMFCEFGCLQPQSDASATDSTAARTVSNSTRMQPALNVTTDLASSTSSSSSERSESEGALVLQPQQPQPTPNDRAVKTIGAQPASLSSATVSPSSTALIRIPLDDALGEPLVKRYKSDSKDADEEGPNDEVVFIKQFPPSGAPTASSSTASSPTSTPLLAPATATFARNATAPTPSIYPNPLAPKTPSSSAAFISSASFAPPTSASTDRRTIILRTELLRHREVCPKFPIHCAFCEDVVLPRGKMKDHVERNVVNHLTSMKTQLERARNLIAELKAEVRSQVRYFHIEHVLIGVGETQRRHEARIISGGNPGPFRMEFESKEQNTGSHVFTLYALIEGNKVGLFLKYKQGPLPVLLEFTVCIGQNLDAIDDDSSGDERNSTGERRSFHRVFAKRSTRYTIEDANRSVVGFSQVATLLECEEGGVYSPHEPDLEADVLTVGIIFRTLPPPAPTWLRGIRGGSH